MRIQHPMQRPRQHLLIMSVMTVLFVISSGCSTAIAKNPAKPAKSATHTATAELMWVKTPFGPMASPINGDFSKGHHLTYIKFSPGMKTPLHTHSSDYVGIVISGTTRHWLPGKPETEKQLPPGSHWFMPANVEHVSECLPGTECVMAITQQAAFDFLPSEAAVVDQLDDVAIVAIYNQVNTFDIETGRLGVEKGYSDQVKKLGEMVLKDHTTVRKMASDLAKRIGVEPALPAARQTAAKDHLHAMAMLRSKSGQEFDRAYLSHEIQFHTDAINAVKQVLLPSIQNPELKKLLRDVLPGFEHHLAQTRSVAKALGYQ